MEGQTTKTAGTLPNFKNNEERKQWLKNYEDWGIWYRDDNIGATYYRYIFENGAQIIVDEYEHSPYGAAYEKENIKYGYYHLVGGPQPPKRNGISKWEYHETYCRFPDSQTYLVNFLLEAGKKGQNNGKTDS